MKKTLIAAAIACFAGPAFGADSMIMNKQDLKWGDAPPSLPKGAKLAVLNGDPGKPGQFTLRLQMPAGYKIAPHWHSQDENLTLVSGTMYLGLGEKMDRSKAHALKAGGYHYLPAKTNHYAYTGKTPAIIQVSGEGPFDINWINPADDPEKMAAKAKAKM
jgi:quercetin dioxygenase-like cupin family protein